MRYQNFLQGYGDKDSRKGIEKKIRETEYRAHTDLFYLKQLKLQINRKRMTMQYNMEES